MMNIAVCEDNAADMDAICGHIESYCEKNCYMNNIHRFSSGEALLAAFSPGAFDVIFLDIYLTGITGMYAARKIRETDPGCALIFITTSRDYALEAFSVRADTYVLKPASAGNIKNALDICRRKFIKNSRFIKVSIGRQPSMDIPLPGIRYIEVYNKEALFHMGANVIKTRLPLDEIEDKLGGGSFLRCHRCYIVNMNYVDDIRERDFLMKNGDIVPIRKSGFTEIRLAFARFMTGNDSGGNSL